MNDSPAREPTGLVGLALDLMSAVGEWGIRNGLLEHRLALQRVDELRPVVANTVDLPAHLVVNQFVRHLH